MKKLLYVLACTFLYVHTSFSQPWQPLPGGPLGASVSAMIYYGGYLWVGGQFTSAGPLVVQNVVRHDGFQWIVTPGLPGAPVSFHVYNNELYALDGFPFGPVSCGVMKWNGSSWQQLAQIINGDYFQTATIYNGELVAGGRFLSLDGISIEHLAKFNGITWSQFCAGATENLPLLPEIRALLVAHGFLYSGGIYNKICGTSVAHCARWEGSSWTPLNVGPVNTFYLYGTDVLVGGPFSSAGPANSKGIAKEDTVSVGDWLPLSPADNGVKMAVNSITEWNGKLYVGGNFSSGIGANVGNCGYWNGTSWTQDNTGISSSAVNVLYTDTVNNILYAGGNFSGGGMDYIAYKAFINLPIELTSFICEKSEDKVLLSWTTAVEINSDHFTLSVSADECEYGDIATIPALGNSSTSHTYSYTYNPRGKQLHYFRLKEFDRDGGEKGEWKCSLSAFIQSPFYYDVPREAIICGDCSEDISVYSALGVFIEKRKSPISVENYVPGFYIAKNSDFTRSVRFIISQ